MSKRKIFEKQIVDFNTGEVTSEESHYTKDNSETFGMHRTTEGVDWIFQFTGNEIQMLVILLELEDNKTGIVSLSHLKKQHLLNKFQKTERYLRSILTSLEGKKALLKLSVNDILLNPTYFYKGGTKIFKAKLNKWKDLNGITEIEPNTNFDNE